MNAAHNMYVNFECNGKRYTITVQVDNKDRHPNLWRYWACGSDYTDPMESPTGWGETPEEAISAFFIDLIRHGSDYQKSFIKTWRKA